MYMTSRAWMSLIMDLIGPELFELSALELEKIAIFDFIYTLASANIDQISTKLGHNIYTHNASDSLIMGQIESEHPELFALEFGKNC